MRRFMLTGRDIVCLSTQDWNGLWTRKQRFMKMFAEAGNRILYVETPVHLLGLDVLPQDPGRFLRFLGGPRWIQDRLYVATLPVLLPFFQMSHLINRWNHQIIRRLLRKWIRGLEFSSPLYWIYTPFSAAVLNGTSADAVYECVDEFRATRGFVNAKVIGEMETDLLKKVKLTIVTQGNLLRARSAVCSNTFCLPNAADVAQFDRTVRESTAIPDDMMQIPAPRLGFLGHIQYWVDLNLIRYLAERRPTWSFVLIGPPSPLAQLNAVKGLPNVYLLGRKPQDQVPAYLRALDCCLNPYVTGELSKNCSPLKLYEYMAAGKPAVSTDMPEARKFEGVVRIAGTYDEFLKHCDTVIDSLPEPEPAIQSRVRFAAQHSWENRFAQLNGYLDRVFKN